MDEYLNEFREDGIYEERYHKSGQPFAETHCNLTAVGTVAVQLSYRFLDRKATVLRNRQEQTLPNGFKDIPPFYECITREYNRPETTFLVDFKLHLI